MNNINSTILKYKYDEYKTFKILKYLIKKNLGENTHTEFKLYLQKIKKSEYDDIIE
jgi:hypothetical protein